MSMLAGPRRKQKVSSDPRNLAWKNDTEKFGQKLMEKMGWTDGKGLGANENGSIEAIKITLKDDSRGVGCSKSYADNWIAHQDDFNSLLMNLKENHGVSSDTEASKVQNLEERSKNSKSRVHYMKFAKGKDLSMKSKEDLACVFGWKKSNSAPVTPQGQSEESSDAEGPDKDMQASHGVVTVNSGTSVQEYFAKKMAELKKIRSGLEGIAAASPVENSLNMGHEVVRAGLNDNPSGETPPKKKKKKHRKKETIEIEEGIDQDEVVQVVPESAAGDSGKKKSKKRKSKCREEASEEIASSGSPGNKQDDTRELDPGEGNAAGTAEPPKKRKKTKKNREQQNDSSSEAVLETKEKIHKAKHSKDRELSSKPEPLVDNEPIHKDSDQLSCQNSSNVDEFKVKETPKLRKRQHIEEQPDVVPESAAGDSGKKKNKKKKSKCPEEAIKEIASSGSPGSKHDNTRELDPGEGNTAETAEPSRKKKKKKKKNREQQNDSSSEAVLETINVNETEKSERKKNRRDTCKLDIEVKNAHETRCLSVNEIKVESQEIGKNVKVEDFGFKGSNIADISGYGNNSVSLSRAGVKPE